MSIEEIKQAIVDLPDDEKASFRTWFELHVSGFDDDDWDRQIRRDAEAGQLDDLAEQALRDDREGRTTEL